jgi:hypothetical protein
LRTATTDVAARQVATASLAVRTPDGEIRWMDVSAYLKRESAGEKTVRQIIFAGERFDAVSVQNWRKKILDQSK